MRVESEGDVPLAGSSLGKNGESNPSLVPDSHDHPPQKLSDIKGKDSLDGDDGIIALDTADASPDPHESHGPMEGGKSWGVPGVPTEAPEMDAIFDLIHSVRTARSPKERGQRMKKLKTEHSRLCRVAKNRTKFIENNLSNVNFFEKWFQTWLTPVIYMSSEHQVIETDFGAPPKANEVDTVLPRFRAEWTKELNKSAAAAAAGKQRPPSLNMALYRTLPGEFYLIALFEFLYRCFTFASPYIIEQLTDFFDDAAAGKSTNTGMGILWAFLMGMASVATSSCAAGKFFQAALMGTRARTALVMAVFEKALTIAPSAKGGVTTGYVMNLMSSDAFRAVNLPTLMHLTWADPLQVIVCMILLYIHLGIAAFVAVGAMLLLLPIQLFMARYIVGYRVAAIGQKDKRVKLVNEMLQGVRVIKLYAWEAAVRKSIADVREKEISYLRRGLLLRALNSVMLFLWPALVTYLTVLTYAEVNDEGLTSGKIFLILSFLNVIRFPITILPYTVQEIADFLVASRRIRDYLVKADMLARPMLPPAPYPAAAAAAASGSGAGSSDPAGFSEECVPEYARPYSVAARHASFTWAPPVSASADAAAAAGAAVPILADINLALPQGTLAAVVGPVGVGKSSLLLALLGEMHQLPTLMSFSSDNNDSSVVVGAMPPGLTSHELSLWSSAPSYSPPLVGIAAAMGGSVQPDPPVSTAAGADGVPEWESEAAFEECPLSPDTGLPLPSSFASLPPAKYAALADSHGGAGLLPDAAHALELACLRGRVGYLSQDPWIIHGSVRDNITLGLPFHRGRFNAAVAAAALTTDLEILQNGEDTQIGEQGVNLSGGQRARVAMARLVYRADLIDVCLIDDPLSAVDMGVGRHIFEQCIMGVLKNKTRLLCLNSHLHILKHADTVIVIGPPGAVSAPAADSVAGHSAGNSAADSAAEVEDDVAAHSLRPRVASTILAQGPYDALKASNIDFSAFEQPIEAEEPPTGASNGPSGDFPSTSRAPGAATPSAGPRSIRAGPLSSRMGPMSGRLGPAATPSMAGRSRALSRVGAGAGRATPLHGASAAPLSSAGGLSRGVSGPEGFDLGAPAADSTGGVRAAPAAAAASGEEGEGGRALLGDRDLTSGEMFVLSSTTTSPASAAAATAGADFTEVASPVTVNNSSNNQNPTSSIPHVDAEAVNAAYSVNTQLPPSMSTAAAAGAAVAAAVEAERHPTGAHGHRHDGANLLGSNGVDGDDDDDNADGAVIEEGAGEDSADSRPRRAAVLGEETLGSGQVTMKTYWTYLRGGASTPVAVGRLVIIACAAIFAQFMRQLIDWWMLQWADDSPTTPASDHTLGWWEESTISLIAICFAALCVRSGFLIAVNISASRSLHDSNFARVLRAPMSWFDTTPMGQALNRFSKDMDEVDAIVPDQLLTVVQQSLMLIGIAVMACMSTPIFLAPFAVIVFFMYLSQRVFRPAATAVKRVESRSFSPVYASFSAATGGAATLRAFAISGQFMRRHITLVDSNSYIMCLFHMMQRWLSFRLDMLSCVYMFAVGVMCVLLRHDLDAAIAGLAVVYSYQLTGLVQWTVRSHVILESGLTSVERIEQYQDLPQEPEYRTDRPALDAIKAAAATHAPNPALVAAAGLSRDLYGWPWAGKVRFRRVTLRYRPDLPIVVNELSFDVPAGSKVGVVGRTGAGKSTILLSLFRMMGIEAGRIEIDGVDTRTIGLGDLRARISIIPQQPVLFSGTVRYNLDPFGEHAEQALWQALRRVQMYSSVRALPGGLEAPVEEQGSNFSQGQRQLLCIARALLRQNKIIVLDEATAAVDLATDAAIQTAIRECFADCTVITIAHRLETIADYDYVLVLGPTDADAAEEAHARRTAAAAAATEAAAAAAAPGSPAAAAAAAILIDESEAPEPGAVSSRLDFDTPYNLLRNPASALYRMASEGGPQVLSSLTAKARAAARAKARADAAAAASAAVAPAAAPAAVAAVAAAAVEEPAGANEAVHSQDDGEEEDDSSENMV